MKRMTGLSFLLLYGFTCCAAAVDSQAVTWAREQQGKGALATAVVMEVRGKDVAAHGFGVVRPSLDAKPDADTQFQIGSVTKVLTFMLLAEMAAQDQVDESATIGSLQLEWKFRNPEVAKITLDALATHSSGLPRLPANLAPADPQDPYADYDDAALRAGVETTREGQPLGHFYAYSNFGAGLLGWLLGEVDGKGYRKALEDRVIEPLGLRRTAFAPGENSAIAISGGKPVPIWHIDALSGAGVLWSSGNDLARLLQVFLGTARSPLHQDLKRDLDIVVEEADGFSLSRVWHVGRAGGAPVYWHNGATAGFHSFVGFRPDEKRGIVVLVSGDADPTAVGLAALGVASVAPKARAIDRDVAGQYALDTVGLGIFERNGLLMTQLTGQPALRLHPLSGDWYALSEADASLHVVRENGRVRAVEVVQNGKTQTFERTGDVANATSRREITLEPEVLQSYVGEYSFAPQAVLTVKLEGGQLQAQLTGQSFLPLFASERDHFFYKVVDAQLVFERDAQKRVVAVVLHQGGGVQRAVREQTDKTP
jgi:CubicO group peptidase (beta-lactamase class C family)